MSSESPPPADQPPAGPVTIPPEQPPEQVQIGLADILGHMSTDARVKMTVAPAAFAGAAADDPRVTEVATRLENVARLSAELRAELEALQALRPDESA